MELTYSLQENSMIKMVPIPPFKGVGEQKRFIGVFLLVNPNYFTSRIFILHYECTYMNMKEIKFMQILTA